MSKKSDLVQHMSRLDEAKFFLAQRDRETTDIGEMERLEKERRVYKFMFGMELEGDSQSPNANLEESLKITRLSVDKPVVAVETSTHLPKKAKMEDSASCHENSFGLSTTQFSADHDSSSTYLHEKRPLKVRIYLVLKNNTMDKSMAEELQQTPEAELKEIWSYLIKKGIGQEAFKNLCTFLCQANLDETSLAPLLEYVILYLFNDADEVTGTATKLLLEFALKHEGPGVDHLIVPLLHQRPFLHRNYNLLFGLLSQLQCKRDELPGQKIWSAFLSSERVIETEEEVAVLDSIASVDVKISDSSVIKALCECLERSAPIMSKSANFSKCLLKVIKCLPNGVIGDSDYGHLEQTVSTACTSALVRKVAMCELGKKRK